jgi:hypothetical protein
MTGQPCNHPGCVGQRTATWWPARNNGGLTELWLVTDDTGQLLTTAPVGMYQPGQTVRIPAPRTIAPVGVA